MIPLCLVLNLDGEDARLAHFADQAAHAGVKFERISAVDARVMPASALAQAIDPWAIYPLAPSDVGCLLSHRRAWERIVQSHMPWGTIFEDDACLSPQTGDLIDALPFDLVAPTIIKLETYGDRQVALGKRRISFAGRSLQKLRGLAIGTAGYALNRSACLLLLDEKPCYALPPDLYLFSRRYGAFKNATVFVMNPAPVIQADRLDEKKSLFVSSYSQRGKQMRPRLPMSRLARREIYRVFEQFAAIGSIRTVVPWS